jgi:hypothetical protein
LQALVVGRRHASSSLARPATLQYMGELASQTGKKLLAIGVLVIAAYVLFKLVLGFVTAIAWFVVVVLAIIAIVWALRVL